MKKYLILAFTLFLFSCNFFKKKQQHVFIYRFENETKVDQKLLLETIEIIDKRLMKMGINYEIKPYDQDNIKILVKANELNDKRLNALILNPGKLEFWELYRGQELLPFFIDINTELKNTIKEDLSSEVKMINPLTDLIVSMGYQGGPIIFQEKAEYTAKVTSMLNVKEAKRILNEKYFNTKFLWGIPDDNHHIPLYLAKSNIENKAPLNGESIIEAFQNYDVLGRPTISINMDQNGALIWERLTGNASNNSTNIAITLNNLVFSAPSVNSGPIKAGQSEISGDFTLQQAQDLAIVLSSQKEISRLKLLQYVRLKN